MNLTDAGYLVLVLGYSGALIAGGLWLSRGVRSTKDFFVAGRDLPAGLIFSTFLAANIGAGSTVGATGRGYEQGLSAVWWVGSAGLGSLVLAFWVGPRIYEFARAHNLYTVGDYLELRYSRGVRLFFAGLLWVGSLFILAAQLIAIAWILNVCAGLPKELGCMLGGLVVAAYFAAGGLKTTAWLNVIQLSLKMLGFFVVVPWALMKIGGWSALETTTTPAGYLSPVGIGPKGVLSYLVIFLPNFFISPGLVQKLYGARDASAVRWGVGAQALGLLAYAPLPAILGMVAHTAYPGLLNSELALPTVLKEMLPWWMGALLLGAVFSAELSASDAILFMLSTSLSKDLYKGYLNPAATEANLLRVSRFAALAAGLTGVALAILLPSVVSALTVFYGLLTVVLLVPLLSGLYLRFPGARAAMITMVAGGTVAVAAHLLTEGKGVGILNPVALGILAAAAVMTVFGVIHHAK